MKDLLELRKEIDNLDQKLITLLSERMELVKAVGAYKKTHQIEVVDMSRWQQVLSSKVTLAHELGLDEDLVTDIYNRIHAAAINLEKDQT